MKKQVEEFKEKCSEIREAEIQARKKELRAKYPWDQGYYHMFGRIKEGESITEQDAQGLFDFTFKALLEDPEYIVTEIAQDYTIVVGREKDQVPVAVPAGIMPRQNIV